MASFWRSPGIVLLGRTESSEIKDRTRATTSDVRTDRMDPVTDPTPASADKRGRKETPRLFGGLLRAFQTSDNDAASQRKPGEGSGLPGWESDLADEQLEALERLRCSPTAVRAGGRHVGEGEGEGEGEGCDAADDEAWVTGDEWLTEDEQEVAAGKGEQTSAGGPAYANSDLCSQAETDQSLASPDIPPVSSTSPSPGTISPIMEMQQRSAAANFGRSSSGGLFVRSAGTSSCHDLAASATCTSTAMSQLTGFMRKLEALTPRRLGDSAYETSEHGSSHSQLGMLRARSSSDKKECTTSDPSSSCSPDPIHSLVSVTRPTTDSSQHVADITAEGHVVYSDIHSVEHLSTQVSPLTSSS